MIKIIDVNQKERIVTEIRINKNFLDFVEAVFPDGHIEWFPRNQFIDNNPTIEVFEDAELE